MGVYWRPACEEEKELPGDATQDAFHQAGFGSTGEERLPRDADVSTVQRVRGIDSSALGQSGGSEHPSCSWFNTSPAALPVLVHNRLKAHRCRVQQPIDAQLFFIPF